MIFEFRNLHYLDQKFDRLYSKYQIYALNQPNAIFFKEFYITTCMNCSTDFSQNLRTKSKQCLPKQLAWKTIRTQTKFRNKKSSSYKFGISDIAEFNFTITSH